MLLDKRPEEEQEYYKKIVDLLSHYEEGWDIFINASKAKDFDYPVIKKEEFKDDPYLPNTWLALVDEVIRIIAHDKFKLQTYPNRIEIIRSDQMLDAYTTTGLPDSYKHWSFGKRREMEERKYDASSHLAYEIVINSLPCIAYCMESNSPVMQALVIAHASYGHNAVFKNNYLFQEFTNAETILKDMRDMRDYVFECEQNYGWKEVSDFLDFCHAMQFMDTPGVVKKKLPKKEREAREERRRQAIMNEPHRESVFKISDDAQSAFNGRDKEPGQERGYIHKGEENILGYMAENAPHLADWQRNLMRMRSGLSQYFKPQIVTKVLNEGMATFFHDKILTTLYDIGLFDWGMNMEFKKSHEEVTYQPSAIRERQNPWTGEMEKVFVGADMNPYALGYSILKDVERICMNPTEEDKEWFPYIAGNGDWLETVLHIMESTNDETFVEQYLSPTVMRKFGLFSLEDSERERDLIVTAVQEGDGFRKVRDVLARQYRVFDMIPDISVHDYQERSDRCLILRHKSHNGMRLDEEDTQRILEFMHRYWEHPIVIESVNEDRKIIETHSSPPNYNYKAQRRNDLKAFGIH